MAKSDCSALILSRCAKMFAKSASLVALIPIPISALLLATLARVRRATLNPFYDANVVLIRRNLIAKKYVLTDLNANDDATRSSAVVDINVSTSAAPTSNTAVNKFAVIFRMILAIFYISNLYSLLRSKA